MSKRKITRGQDTLVSTLMAHYYRVYEKYYLAYMRGDLQWYEWDGIWSTLDLYRYRKIEAIKRA